MDIHSLSSQSERAKNTIHCFSIYKRRISVINCFVLTHWRHKPHQKVKNSLTFHWPLNSFYWPFIIEKQSMFTFALAFFAGHRFFFFSFSTSFRFSREEEEGIWKKAFTMTTTDHNYICQTLNVKLIALLALQHPFHLFRKKMHFKVLKKT